MKTRFRQEARVKRSIAKAVKFGRVWAPIKPPIQEPAVCEDKSKA